MDKIEVENVTGLSALQIYQQRVRSGEITPTPRKDIKEKWELDKTSLRKCVNYMCWQCMGGYGSNNVNQDIRDCTSKDCALYNIRPYT